MTVPLAAFVLAMASGAARANGLMVSVLEGTGAVRSADFRAVYVLHGDATTAVVQSGISGDAPDFAWVLPIPAPVVDDNIGVVDPAAIDDLIARTDPRYYDGAYSSCGGSLWGGMYGCSSDEAAIAGTASTGGLGEWTAGPYEVVLLSPEESSDPQVWLETEGYDVAEDSGSILASYAAEGWYFLVVELTDAALGSGTQGLPCLAFTYESAVAAHPIRISSTTSEEEVETLVLALGSRRMTPRDDPEVVPELGGWLLGGTAFTDWYNARARLAIDATGGRAWVVEYAGDPAGMQAIEPGDTASVDLDLTLDSATVAVTPLLDDLVAQGLLSQPEADSISRLTRIRTWLSPAEMDADLVLAPSADDSEYRVELHAAGTVAAAAPILPLLALGWSCRRRTGSRRSITARRNGAVAAVVRCPPRAGGSRFR